LTLEEAMAALEALGTENTRRLWRNHGAVAPMFGVKVGDMKSVLKVAGKDHGLALALWETGNVDARYLAALMCTPGRMTPPALEGWARTANSPMNVEYSVPWVAAESGHGWPLAKRWVDDSDANLRAAGWATLASVVALTPDDALDAPAIAALLDRVPSELGAAPSRVRSMMAQAVAAVGIYVAGLRAHALSVAAAMEPVVVDVGATSCKVPQPSEVIAAAVARGATAKRKKVRC
jgi:3-methyladenine DNA glycosylase AlkD